MDSVNKTNHAIYWIVIYPVNSVIHFSNNQGLFFKQTDMARRKTKLFCLSGTNKMVKISGGLQNIGVLLTKRLIMPYSNLVLPLCLFCYWCDDIFCWMIKTDKKCHASQSVLPHACLVLHINFQMHWSNVLNGFNHFYWFFTLYCQSKIDQQLTSAQLTRLWRFNPTNSVVVPQSLILRYVVLAWILFIKIGLILTKD